MAKNSEGSANTERLEIHFEAMIRENNSVKRKLSRGGKKQMVHSDWLIQPSAGYRRHALATSGAAGGNSGVGEGLCRSAEGYAKRKPRPAHQERFAVVLEEDVMAAVVVAEGQALQGPLHSGPGPQRPVPFRGHPRVGVGCQRRFRVRSRVTVRMRRVGGLEGATPVACFELHSSPSCGWYPPRTSASSVTLSSLKLPKV